MPLDYAIAPRPTAQRSRPSYAARRPPLRPFSACRADFADGSDSPRHFLERCLEEIDRLEPTVRAFVSLDAEAARRLADDASVRHRHGRALSAVDGLPLGAKDIIETRQLPTEMNSPIFAGYQPRRDAACIIALRRAGAIVLGKTVTTEFACGRAGPTRNPHDPTRTPGGSSSGSAAAVGAGMVPLALGTQTQASVIRPASYCGAYALKPSHGLLCFDGTAPLAASLDTLGIFGANLDDVWAATTVIAALGPGPGGPRLDLPDAMPTAAKPRRLVRLDTAGWAEVDADARAAFERAIDTLAGHGVAIVDRRTTAEVEAFEQALAEASEVSIRVFAYESQWPLRAYADCGADLVGERVRDLLARADRMTDGDYREAVAARLRLRTAACRLAEQADGFVALASSGPAIADIAYTGSRSYPVPWSLVAGPSLSLPVMDSRGLPLGLQVMGPPASDLATVATARWIAATLLA
ncbi:amidase [Rhodoplanes roseus]|uniref:Amidase domain-containing protein n=1 Tax=Rhodoplanes roseus TaxID=29409 RepID=A0A327L7Z4_9BRAD|nr:amidase [Rhodoplanes roseus]RAI43798.1 hypothetical protein CH341_12475 [Rhodoplanes roseus]